MNPTDTSLVSLLQTIYRWRKPLLRLTVAVALGVAAISFFMPNYYRAFSKFIATNPTMNTPQAMFSEGDTHAMSPYGSPEDLDRLMNVAQSGELVDSMALRFGLYHHYDIDSTDARAPLYLSQKFFKLYSVTKDEYGAIELTMEDKNPKLAAAMANGAVEIIANLDRRIATENLRKVMNGYEESLKEQSYNIKRLTDSINTIYRNYKYQSIAIRREVLTQALPGMSSDAQIGLIQRAARISNDSLAHITENLSIAGFLDGHRSSINGSYVQMNSLYSRTKASLAAGVQPLQVLERASVPLSKSRPVRSFMVMMSAVLALFFGMVAVILFEQYKRVEWNAIFKD